MNATKDKKFVVNKVTDKLNVSDTCTTHVDCSIMMKLIDSMGTRLTNETHATAQHGGEHRDGVLTCGSYQRDVFLGLSRG